MRKKMAVLICLVSLGKNEALLSGLSTVVDADFRETLHFVPLSVVCMISRIDDNNRERGDENNKITTGLQHNILLVQTLLLLK